jgi:hypothetical protein
MGEKSDTDFLDRRRFPRYPCTGDAEILQSGERWGWGTVSDISRGGCYIETMHPLPTGTEAQLRLVIAGIFLDISASVVSSDPMFGMGMDFLVVPTELWNKLPQIIEKVTGSTASRNDGESHEDSQPHMQAALQYLERAQRELRDAMPGRGEHRARALQLTESAINEVTKACKQGSTIKTTDPASIGSGFSVDFDRSIDSGLHH